MKMKHLLIALALLLCGQCYAQKGHTVHGVIADAANHPLPSGEITLTSGWQQMKAKADRFGKFVFAMVKGDSISVTASSAGYQAVKKHYILPAGNLPVDLGFIALVKQTTLPGQVAKAKPAILKEDTTQYQAGAYKAGGRVSVQDLVKKMPGITIDENGNVSAGDSKITRIRVNGKDYTGDIRSVTRNLPADVLENVQIVNDYGDQAATTGIKTSNPEKILNITTAGAKGGNDNESYKGIVENEFNPAGSNPLSTFSVDVDAASYSNVRRFINQGQLPPADAVRIEEMINYFTYNLPAPTNGEPVAIHTELSEAPWNPKHRLLRIGLKAKTLDTQNLPPSNLVFLIDVSGSMDQPNKLPLVKSSIKMLVEQLRPQDKVAIVVYAGNAGLVLPSTAGDRKSTINDAIDNLSAGGSTAGGEGIKLAYKIARENFMANGNNRIVMCTDGDFNVGPASDGDMEQLITRERDSKVAISIMGFGMGNYKDSKMETLADKGNGNYAYIDNITEAHKALVSEFGGTLFIIAKDVKLQVEFNPAKVQAYRLLGYEDRMLAKEDFNDDKKDAGDMGLGHTVTALYEIIPAGIKDDYAGNVDPLKYQKAQPTGIDNSSDEMLTIKFRYKDPDSVTSKLIQVSIKDKPGALGATSADFRFAAAVAEFGMLLRGSQFKQQSTFAQVVTLCKGSKGNDEEGYRSEFIRLAESARSMANELAAK